MAIDKFVICLLTDEPSNEALTQVWQDLEEHGFDPHAWYDQANCISMQQWYDAVESEMVLRGLF
ncbi:MAG: hypothetical protein C3F02_02275 [Parcubacteria group bacterium]|nr:MAG: hypothetical protein C3F02_02275 [Parcubacteria group bacterium]